MAVFFGLIVEGVGIAAAESAVDGGALTLANNGVK